MAAIKKVKICKKCSGITPAELLEHLPAQDFTTFCIAECGKHEGKIAAYVQGELVIFDSKEAFFAHIDALE
ncbi:MAG: hypothetical protein LBO63_01540 [Oscillospiraceae bacterium]|nr:hypothetical protein [Oscillospiraceae bacterium]